MACGDGPEGDFHAEARIRNAGEAMPCRAEVEPDGRATLTFDDPQYGVSAGQAAVFCTTAPGCSAAAGSAGRKRLRGVLRYGPAGLLGMRII